METKVYNTDAISNMMKEWYTPFEIAEILDEMMFFYATNRMNEGGTCSEDGKVLHALKMLRDAFRKV